MTRTVRFDFGDMVLSSSVFCGIVGDECDRMVEFGKVLFCSEMNAATLSVHYICVMPHACFKIADEVLPNAISDQAL